MNATSPDALVERATAILAADPLRAEAACREALALSASHVGALGVLGYLLHVSGRHGEAEQTYAQLTRLVPDEPGWWANLGTARRCLQRYDEALHAYARAAELGADSADFLFNVGLAHVARRDWESARAVLKQAKDLAPDDAEIRLEYAKACYESLHSDEALDALSGWADRPGLEPELLAQVAQRLMNLGDVDGAERALRALGPHEALPPATALTAVKVLERTNRVGEARALLDRIATDPRADTVAVDLALAEAALAAREGRHEAAVHLYRQALDRNDDVATRHFELFPLAHSLDALGRYPEAFSTLVEAHRSQVAHIREAAPLAAVRGVPTLKVAEYATDPADVAEWRDEGAPPVERSPVFVVAFPRSGTTLLELVLDAHPALRSMDEQPFLQNALDDLLALGVRYPDDMRSLTSAQLDEVRGKYFARVARKVSLAPGQRIVDKNPLNILRLPVIRRVFPNARVVLAVRHPLDVVLSCYMQHFRAPDFALLCSDVVPLAQGYRRAFDAWYREVATLQPAVFEIRYEELVADFERGVRALAAFLELPWNDAMLEPGRRARERRYISTPSYAQVVQPVTTRAVGRWHRYESELAPAVPEVQSYLERWGYEGVRTPGTSTG